MTTKFKVRSAKQFASKLSARIHKSGRLGFGEKERTQMNLADGVYVTFVSTLEDVAATHLVIKRSEDEDAFQLKKGNTNYPFVDTKQLFDFFGIDYATTSTFFDLTREDDLDEELGGEVYRVCVRVNEKNCTTEEDVKDMDI